MRASLALASCLRVCKLSHKLRKTKSVYLQYISLLLYQKVYPCGLQSAIGFWTVYWPHGDSWSTLACNLNKDLGLSTNFCKLSLAFVHTSDRLYAYGRPRIVSGVLLSEMAVFLGLGIGASTLFERSTAFPEVNKSNAPFGSDFRCFRELLHYLQLTA